MKNKGDFYMLITAFLWSLGGIFIKLIPLNAVAINGLRSIIALVFFFIYERSFKIKINKKILLAALCLIMTNNLYVLANKMTTAANAIVLQYTAPIFVLLLQSIYTRTLPSKQKIGIIFLAFSGMILFFFDQMDGGQMLGNILAILAGMFFAGVFFVNSLEGASSQDASKLSFLVSFLLAIPFYHGFEQMTVVSISALFALGILQLGLAYVFFAKAITLTSPVNSSLISLIEALLNPLWVFIFLHESPSIFAFIGGTIVLMAIILNILLDKKIDPSH